MNSEKMAAEELFPLGIVAGSGFYEIENLLQISKSRIETPFGKISSDLVSGNWHGREVHFITRHGEGHSIPPHKVNYRANIYALKEAGVKTCIVINCVGGIHKSLLTPELSVFRLIF